MFGRLAHAWTAVRGSLWFVPLLLTVSAAALAHVMPQLDTQVPSAWADTLGLYVRSHASARTLVSTVASSMITIAGVAFSIMMVALQLASSQFGPRLLRNFMRDRGNQVVLGTFVATFVYCLLIMRTLGSDYAPQEAPRVSVTAAVALALVSLGVLIYFIHHAAASMQAPNVIANVSSELRAAIDRLYPESLGEPVGPDRPLTPGGPAGVISSPVTGYLQRVDDSLLLRAASQLDVVAQLSCAPGTFLVEGEELARVWPRERADAACGRIQRACLIGATRTAEQDVRFVIDQLVEIALRALSPAVNDPFTASECIDQLAAGFCRLTTRQPPSPNRRDEAGQLRVVALRPGVSSMLAETFGPIAHAGADTPLIALRLLSALGAVARQSSDPDVHAVVRQEAAVLSDRAATMRDHHRADCIRAQAARVQQTASAAPSRDDISST